MNKSNNCPTLLYIAIAFVVLVSGCSSNSIMDGDVRMNARTKGDGQISRIYNTFNGIKMKAWKLKWARPSPSTIKQL